MDLDAKPLLSPSLNPHLILTPIHTKINNKKKKKNSRETLSSPNHGPSHATISPPAKVTPQPLPRPKQSSTTSVTTSTSTSHAIPPVRPHPLPEQLGTDHEGLCSPYWGCPSSVAATMPTPILATDRSSDGVVSLRPNPTASTIHAVWPNHCKSYYRPSHNIFDNDSLNGSPPTLESREL